MSFARVPPARRLGPRVIPMNGLQDSVRELTHLDKSTCTSNFAVSTSLIVARMDTLATQRRTLAALFAACAIAFVGLLVAHPGGQPRTFAEFVDLELSTQQVGQFVHGGAILVLTLLLSAHVAFARTIVRSTLLGTIAVVFRHCLHVAHRVSRHRRVRRPGLGASLPGRQGHVVPVRGSVPDPVGGHPHRCIDANEFGSIWSIRRCVCSAADVARRASTARGANGGCRRARHGSADWGVVVELARTRGAWRAGPSGAVAICFRSRSH